MPATLLNSRTVGYGGLELITGLSRRTLERYRKSGEIPAAAVVKYSRAIRFRVDEIEKWMATRTPRPEPETKEIA